MSEEESIDLVPAEEKHWTDKFPHLKDEKYPLLFIGFVVNSERFLNVRFKKPWKPVKIEQTTAGLRCGIYYLYGLLLKPKPEVYQNMLGLNGKWLGTNLNAYPILLDEILAYRKNIKNWFKLDCNYSHRYLAEALYPLDIDATESGKSLSRLTDTVLPEDLSELVQKPKTGKASLRIPILHWQLFILGKNSD